MEAKKGDLSSRLQDWVSFTSRSHAVSLSDLVPDPPCLFLGEKNKKDTSCGIRRHHRLGLLGSTLTQQEAD